MIITGHGFRTLGPFLLVAAMLALLPPEASIGEPERREVRSDDQTDSVRNCKSHDRLLVTKATSINVGRYEQVEVNYDCAQDQHSIDVVATDGTRTELDRFDAIYGAQIEVRIFNFGVNKAESLVLVTYGSEWIGDSTFVVDVYRVESKLKVFSGWSSNPPRVEDLNDDGSVELVLFEDLYSVKRPDVTNWPNVYQLLPVVRPMSLRKVPALIAELVHHSELSAIQMEGDCKAFAKQSCPLESNLGAMRKQIACLRALQE